VHARPWDQLGSQAQHGGIGTLRWSDEPLDRAVLGWDRTLGAADRALLARVDGPTVDLGCGPGRLTAAVIRAGFPALGVDISPSAVRLARRRGASALAQCLFDPVPGEGTWTHVLLADGNIGIGGDPRRLLRRAATLLVPGGAIHVELDRPEHHPGRMILRLSAPPDLPAVALPWARCHRLSSHHWQRLAYCSSIGSGSAPGAGSQPPEPRPTKEFPASRRRIEEWR
jgi:SAM-dependent methyltransferase